MPRLALKKKSPVRNQDAQQREINWLAAVVKNEKFWVGGKGEPHGVESWPPALDLSTFLLHPSFLNKHDSSFYTSILYLCKPTLINENKSSEMMLVRPSEFSMQPTEHFGMFTRGSNVLVLEPVVSLLVVICPVSLVFLSCPIHKVFKLSSQDAIQQPFNILSRVFSQTRFLDF